jgi:hypothetical protein
MLLGTKLGCVWVAKLKDTDGTGFGYVVRRQHTIGLQGVSSKRRQNVFFSKIEPWGFDPEILFLVLRLASRWSRCLWGEDMTPRTGINRVADGL